MQPVPVFITRPLVALLLLAPIAIAAQTRPLNDTGSTWSGHATNGNAATCDASHPAGQDCRYGATPRPAQAS